VAGTGLTDAIDTHAIDTDAIDDDLAVVTGFDRLQGSIGLARAAEAVAERAAQAGLKVDIRWYQPRDRQRWWTYSVPAAASPVNARLEVETPAGYLPVTQYPQVPCSLGRGSASSPTGGCSVPVAEEARPGAFILVPPGVGDLDALVARLASVGALGFAVESAGGRADHAVDRLEVSDDCPLMAFSVSAEQARLLRDAARRQRLIRAEVNHSAPAAMPLVCGQSPAPPDAPRALLMAHLCHPQPGANDNASGVAALLAVARAAASSSRPGPGLGLSFLWAPEMVGTAAYLHDVMAGHRPEFALSLDMVGSQRSALVIEPPPPYLTSPLGAALDVAAATVCPPAVSYSGAVELPMWPVRLTPFVGASDHLLLADRAIGVPAAQLGNWPDPYRHSSLDDLSQVSAARIAQVAATVLIAVRCLLHGDGGLERTADRVLQLALDDLARTVYRSQTAELDDGSHVSAYYPATCRRTVAQLSRTADATLRGLGQRHPVLASRTAGHRKRLREVANAISRTLPEEHKRAAEQALVRRWSGPWNLRAFIDALPANQRDRIRAIRATGQTAYAWMTALALGIDGTTGQQALVELAAITTELDIPRRDAEFYLEALVNAGWADLS
jgi:hypothetical protein